MTQRWWRCGCEVELTFPVITIAIQVEEDVVLARQRMREIAAILRFDAQQQTRMATAVSEVARNAFRYAGGGEARFLLEGENQPQLLMVQIIDHGPGLSNLSEIQAGTYKSKTGLGVGLLGTQRLVDRMTIEATPGGGTTVTLGKLLPREAPFFTPDMIPALRPTPSVNLLEEFRGQNRELLLTLNELRRRQEELVRLNRELEDTNRGVVALYSELDEKADSLRRADDVKSRFLSNMSHEFRTPLNSMLALSRILLDKTDGPLTPEQERQVGYIRKAAESLTELVNDLLDLARVEAGKSVIRKTEFHAENLFAALRGMLRPLLVTSAVSLIFEDIAPDFPSLYTDEGKLAQILRNFISNALKFTERGSIRVSADLQEFSDTVRFSVSDTGIGIAEQDKAAIFEEFTQIENPIQQYVKGTGLGLPLSKRLAELLGGRVAVESAMGAGSTFSVTLPRILGDAPPVEAEYQAGNAGTGKPVVVVEDHQETRTIYERHLLGSQFRMVPALSLRQARTILTTVQPAAILLDLLLDGEESWGYLAELKSDPATQSIPIIVITTVIDKNKILALGADAYAVKPVTREELLRLLGEVTDRK